jgi:hypothetical protein
MRRLICLSLLFLGITSITGAATPPQNTTPSTSCGKSSSLPENAWQLRVNTTYQDAMKTFMSLVTASLVLPLFLIRNFLNVEKGKPLSSYLGDSAWGFWGSMALSLLCCMVFFYASAKYVKVVSGGAETFFGLVDLCEPFFENLRDFSVWGSAISFLAGLIFLTRYFVHDIRGQSGTERKIARTQEDRNAPAKRP